MAESKPHDQVTITLCRCDAKPIRDALDRYPEIFPSESLVRLRAVLTGAMWLQGAKGGPCNCGGGHE